MGSSTYAVYINPGGGGRSPLQVCFKSLTIWVCFGIPDFWKLPHMLLEPRATWPRYQVSGFNEEVGPEMRYTENQMSTKLAAVANPT